MRAQTTSGETLAVTHSMHAHVTLQSSSGAMETVEIDQNVGMAYMFACDNLDVVGVDVVGLITSIPPFAFAGCTHLTQVTLSSCVKHICVSAFMNCPITSINLQCVRSIGPRAFTICKSDTLLPNAVYIHEHAFVQHSCA